MNHNSTIPGRYYGRKRNGREWPWRNTVCICGLNGEKQREEVRVTRLKCGLYHFLMRQARSQDIPFGQLVATALEEYAASNDYDSSRSGPRDRRRIPKDAPAVLVLDPKVHGSENGAKTANGIRITVNALADASPAAREGAQRT